MPKILITGANGQLGSEFKAVARAFPSWEFTFTDIKELDITNPEAVRQFFAQFKFDVLVNCAGYTAVDMAEKEPEKALLLNGTAVGYLVRAASENSCYPVHISTDYIFSGNHTQPYREDDIPHPVTAYGKSKLEGERQFFASASKGMIIRTSWLYSAYGNNFVKTILKAGREKSELRVVYDQVGCPTWAYDFARHLLEILPSARSQDLTMICNYSNEGFCSWYELAVEALRLAEIPCKVVPVRTSEYPTLAKRPAYSVLDKTKIKSQFGINLPGWKTSLAKCIMEMNLNSL